MRDCTSNQLVGLLAVAVVIKGHHDCVHATNHINNSAPTCEFLRRFRRVKLYSNFTVLQSEISLFRTTEFMRSSRSKASNVHLVCTSCDYCPGLKYTLQLPWFLFALQGNVIHEFFLWCHFDLLLSVTITYHISHYIKSARIRRVTRGKWKRRSSKRTWKRRTITKIRKKLEGTA
jgi:hypothetical protein